MMSGLDLPDQPVIMGVLNNSPDSFHEESVHTDDSAILSEAKRMIDHGAGIIDIGAESNKPDAELISSERETDRLVPVIEELESLDVPISVDTWKADVARAALEAGVDIINDISGLADPEMCDVAAEYDAPIVIGHSTSVRASLGEDTDYDDVVSRVVAELGETVAMAEEAGVSSENIILDPGINFGKSPVESVRLVARLGEFQRMGYPVLVGHSRKITLLEDSEFGDEVDITLPPTLALTATAAERGADILRVHDVTENLQAVRIGMHMRRMDRRFS